MEEKQDSKGLSQYYRQLLKPQITKEIENAIDGMSVSSHRAVILPKELAGEQKLKNYQIGDRIAGRYEIYNILGDEGKSGMGVVYVCCDHEINRVLALKTFQDKFLSSNRMNDVFKRQVYLCIKVQKHPNILKFCWFQELAGRMFLAFEFIAPDDKGRNTLTHYLNRPISLKQALIWSIQFCHGMEHALKRGVTPHRNIKPDKIMITRDGAVKISHFGLAGLQFDTDKSLNLARMSREDENQPKFLNGINEKVIAGTPPWMAPEQFEGQSDVRSDIYGFGVVMYQMMTKGELPFYPKPGDTWADAHRTCPVPEIDSPLFSIVRKCLEKDPDKRYPTFSELRKYLEQLFSEKITQKTGEALPAPLKKSEPDAFEYKNTGVSLANLGLIDEAIIAYKKALKIDYEDANIHYNLGLAHHDKGQLSEAVKEYKQALRIAPGYSHAYIAMGLALEEKGDLNNALEAFKEVLRINLERTPDHHTAYAYKKMESYGDTKGIITEPRESHVTKKVINDERFSASSVSYSTTKDPMRPVRKKGLTASLVGETIDRFKILKVLGHGGFAITYLAQDTRTSQKVAIKLAKSSFFPFEDDLAKVAQGKDTVPVKGNGFLFGQPFSRVSPRKIDQLPPQQINRILENEGAILKQISHPAFVKVNGEGSYYGIFYLVLEYIEGIRLRDLIRHKQNIPLRYFCDLIDALMGAAHNGLEYHGDLKPENIMIAKDGAIKILDPSSKAELQGIHLTTPQYNPFFERDDITSLGVMLYEVCTGFLPFPHSILDNDSNDSSAAKMRVQSLFSNYVNPIYLNPGIPAGLENVINHALDLEREKGTLPTDERYYDSIDKMKNHIQNVILNEGILSFEVPSINKTDAVLRVILSEDMHSSKEILRKVIDYIISYPDTMDKTRLATTI